MASVHIKTGASGKDSPYWNAKLKGPDGTGWTLTTKLREKKLATRLAGVWETAAEVARNGHLTHAKAQKSLAECEDITRGDGLKKSQEFLDECLRQSTGSGLNIPTPAKYFSELAGGQGTAQPDQHEHADAIRAHPETVRDIFAGHPAALPLGQHHSKRR